MPLPLRTRTSAFFVKEIIAARPPNLMVIPNASCLSIAAISVGASFTNSAEDPGHSVIVFVILGVIDKSHYGVRRFSCRGCRYPRQMLEDPQDRPRNLNTSVRILQKHLGWEGLELRQGNAVNPLQPLKSSYWRKCARSNYSSWQVYMLLVHL
jgi:hypothetical protein